jgi:hypothetical protein
MVTRSRMMLLGGEGGRLADAIASALGLKSVAAAVAVVPAESAIAGNRARSDRTGKRCHEA